MAKFEDDWSGEYREQVVLIEKQLGREICGRPLKTGRPCKNWPVDGGQGRCRKHASSKPVESGKSSDQPGVPGVQEVSSVEQVDDQAGGRHLFKILLLLTLSGFIAGAAAAVAWFQYYSFPISTGSVTQSIQDDSTTTAQPADDSEAGFPEEVGGPDLKDPDFTRIQHFLREGQASLIPVFLEAIVADAEVPADRARALFQLHVFYHHQGDYEAALETIEQLRDRYPDDFHLPEALFSGWRISKQELNDSEQADYYRTVIEDEFGESKWMEELP